MVMGWWIWRCSNRHRSRSWCFIIIIIIVVIISPLMEHQLGLWERLLHNVGHRHKTDGQCGIAREAPLIKHSMTAHNDLLLNWIPEPPCLYTIWIANEDALP
jgi:hypothetical protein